MNTASRFAAMIFNTCATTLVSLPKLSGGRNDRHQQIGRIARIAVDRSFALSTVKFADFVRRFAVSLKADASRPVANLHKTGILSLGGVMRLSATMLIALLSISAITCQAGEWKQVLDGYGLKVYSDTVRSSKDTDGSKVVEFLASWDTPGPIPNGNGGTVKSIKAHAKIFCDRRTYGTLGLRGAGFSEPGMQGDMLFADKSLGYQSIEPETMWYELQAKYCSSWLKKLIPSKVLEFMN